MPTERQGTEHGQKAKPRKASQEEQLDSISTYERRKFMDQVPQASKLKLAQEMYSKMSEYTQNNHNRTSDLIR